MKGLLLCLALSMCVHPDVYCRGRITGETVQDKINDALEDCAPMVRVTVDL